MSIGTLSPLRSFLRYKSHEISRKVLIKVLQHPYRRLTLRPGQQHAVSDTAICICGRLSMNPVGRAETLTPTATCGNLSAQSPLTTASGVVITWGLPSRRWHGVSRSSSITRSTVVALFVTEGPFALERRVHLHVRWQGDGAPHVLAACRFGADTSDYYRAGGAADASGRPRSSKPRKPIARPARP